MEELRKEIDEINDGLLKLFEHRMDVSARIADYKRANGLPVYDAAREALILDKVAAKSKPEYAAYAKEFFRQVIELSKQYQRERNETE